MEEKFIYKLLWNYFPDIFQILQILWLFVLPLVICLLFLHAQLTGLGWCMLGLKPAKHTDQLSGLRAFKICPFVSTFSVETSVAKDSMAFH